MTTKKDFTNQLANTISIVSKTNVNELNRYSNDSSHKAKINFNRLFKVEHFGLNSVLNTILKQYDSNSFKTYLKALKNKKQITIKKSDLTISALKSLFNSADFIVNDKGETRNYIYRLKKIDSIDQALLINDTVTVFNKVYKLENQPAFFEKDIQTKEGTELQCYTIIPKTNFSAWEILGLIEKFKLKETKAETETETETETEKKETKK